jgi:RNase H-fold protein (predicted Holliday junction resolvase)
MNVQKLILAIDPGREKIGVAILDLGGNVVSKAIVSFSEFTSWCDKINAERKFFRVAVGDGTGKERVIDFLEQRTIPYTLVDERGSSEEARELYFREHPPRGWRRLIPRSLLFPERNFDDWQAVVIGRRLLELMQRGESL